MNTKNQKDGHQDSYKSNLKHKNGNEETFMTEADYFDSQHRLLVDGIAIMPSDGKEHRGTLGAIANRQSDVTKPMNGYQLPPPRSNAK